MVALFPTREPEGACEFPGCWQGPALSQLLLGFQMSQAQAFLHLHWGRKRWLLLTFCMSHCPWQCGGGEDGEASDLHRLFLHFCSEAGREPFPASWARVEGLGL